MSLAEASRVNLPVLLLLDHGGERFVRRRRRLTAVSNITSDGVQSVHDDRGGSEQNYVCHVTYMSSLTAI